MLLMSKDTWITTWFGLDPIDKSIEGPKQGEVYPKKKNTAVKCTMKDVGSPIRHAGTPIRSVGILIGHDGTPIRSVGTPVTIKEMLLQSIHL